MRYITCKSQTEAPAVARQILECCDTYRFFAFYGQLGAGKTTIIKALCAVLGAKDTAVSPSFAIMNEYKTAQLNNEKIFHFDFYRIKDITEVYDLGYEEFFYTNNYCFVEWPEIIETLLPPNYVKVQIVQDTITVLASGDTSRKLIIITH